MADKKDPLAAARKAGANSSLVICVARGEAFRHCQNTLTCASGSVLSIGGSVAGVDTVITAVVTGANPEDMESRLAELLPKLMDKGAQEVLVLDVGMRVSIPGR